jgi:NAD(P)-dependent dehydrogenase (short-subunit alcohol dehydrogenase family)
MSRPLFDLTGKTALVTGSTVGIGRMLAQGLADAGARVCIVSRNAEDCATAVKEIVDGGGDAFAIPADLSEPSELVRLAGEFAARQPALHILVNNAGRMAQAPLEDFTVEQWDQVMDLNLRAPFFLVQALLPALLAAADADDPARVINIGSIDGLHVNPMPHYPYSASKAAIHHLTRVLARELAARRITVNAVAPGPFPSKMMAFALDDPATRELIAASNPLGRIGRPDDMAGVAVFLSSRAGSYVNGAVIPVDGGISTTI